ncbi:MAG TPA: potassium-transporting ATPase subunit F [Saprospiraceae bacterium]|nr:potassium-transporting ATPase subunit F [Saprospiraceae bacterium]
MVSLYQSLSPNSNKQRTMTALFIIALVVFGYMCYVLIKPEKF